LPETLFRDICRSNHLPESRNPGNSGISEKLDFDLFVGEQGGMKISTAVSTLFQGSEVLIIPVPVLRGRNTLEHWRVPDAELSCILRRHLFLNFIFECDNALIPH